MRMRKRKSKMLHIDYIRDTFNLLEAKNLAMLGSFEQLEKMTKQETSPSMVLLNCYASFNNGNIKECKSRFKSMGIEKNMFRGDVVLTGIYDMLDKRLDFI